MERTAVPVCITALVVAGLGIVFLSHAPAINIPSQVSEHLYAYSPSSELVSDIEASVQEHANMRHGAEASLARECSGRPEQRFFNPITKRTAYMCIIRGFFGFHILDNNGDEVTAFLKNKMKSFNQVLRYMQNAGYELIH
jgi:hypothetical protein